MSILLLPFKRYFEFSGRSRRLEYWLFQIVIYAGVFVFIFLDGFLGAGGSSTSSVDTTNGLNASAEAEGGILSLIWIVAIIIPAIAVTVRRLHDTNRTGLWVFIGLVPLIGGIWLFVLMCLDGTAGDNRFGPDPKGRLGRRMEEVFE
ncbi:DUF805 domain-containing protein [Consotaella aegiceratis]|uniref:DUF805 domain-containing protein n=1 Tax=Consotaella aegiceratis TaxID=3097961 RepID=UPI002F42BFBC